MYTEGVQYIKYVHVHVHIHVHVYVVSCPDPHVHPLQRGSGNFSRFSLS